MKFYRGDKEGKKIIPENLLAVRELREILLYKPMKQPITVGCLEACDWLLDRFIEVNFSKLTDFPMISCNELSTTLSTLCSDYLSKLRGPEIYSSDGIYCTNR